MLLTELELNKEKYFVNFMIKHEAYDSYVCKSYPTIYENKVKLSLKIILLLMFIKYKINEYRLYGITYLF